MSLRNVLKVVGLVIGFTGIAMWLTALPTFLMDPPSARTLLLSGLLTVAAGFSAYRLSGPLAEELRAREGMAIVTFSWTGAAAFGALPFLLSGTVETAPQAIFESMSGFSTTGASIFSSVESLPPGILLWRSVTHWLGGMGIVVLAIAILPYLGVGGMQLFRAEVPGPTPERLRPRITQTAKFLWFVYVGLTAAQLLLLLLGGMSFFDAVNHAFSTAAAGGFSTRDASIGAFDSAYIEWVTILFMYLAAVNFTLHFRAITGRFVYHRDAEWRFFTGALLVATAVIVLPVLGGLLGSSAPDEARPSIRTALFHVVAIATTTGFTLEDHARWLPHAQATLVGLMFLGGMAASTSGGIKAARILLLIRHTLNDLRRQLHPRAILPVRMGRHVVTEEVMANVLGFIILYVLLLGGGAMVLSFFENDIVTAFSASAASVGNIGPGFGAVGPASNYGWMSDPELLVLSFLMLAGRLEIFTVLLLFIPEFWRRR